MRAYISMDIETNVTLAGRPFDLARLNDAMRADLLDTAGAATEEELAECLRIMAGLLASIFTNITEV